MIQEIVIVGGGFGGVKVAKILAAWHEGLRRHIHITLIDKGRYHTYYPNLYEVATAYLPEAFGQGAMPLDFFQLKSSAIYPLEDIFSDELGVSILEDKVVNIDFKTREISLVSGQKKNYDVLVLATGSETNYFGNKGLMEKGLPMKNFFEALEIRNAVDEAFANTPKNKTVRVVIGGGGFTGCELAGEMMGYFKKLAIVHGRPEGSYECLIIDAADKLLGGASGWVSEKAATRLKNLGVKFKFQSLIKDVTEDEVIVGSGERISYDVLVWTAGVKSNDLAKDLPGVKLEKASCMIVDKYLRIQPYENVFGVGDNTYCIDENSGKSLPMTASVALREAKAAAENIKRMVLKKPFLKYNLRNAGVIVPLGGRYALLDADGLKLTGYFPWLIKMAIALHYWAGLIGWQKSWKVVRQGIKIYKKND